MAEASQGESWVVEDIGEGARFSLLESELLQERQTAFQRLRLFANPTFGKVLMLDDIFQTSERDEGSYHEMLVHLPMLTLGAVRRVLIVGGGDGGTLRHVLLHPSVEAVTLVELDPEVIEFSREHLGALCGRAFEDPRVGVTIADGARFVQETDERYDLILVDSTDPVGPGKVLFSAAFYADCKRCLAEGGAVVTQNAVPFSFPEALSKPVEALRRSFGDVAPYVTTVPLFAVGPMVFCWASDGPARQDADLETLRRRFAALDFEAYYYTPELHLAAFALPAYIVRLV